MVTLKDKITSEEEFNKVVDGYTGKMARGLRGQTRYMPWYLKREWCRIEQGIYPASTETLDFINNAMPHLAVHVSKEDANYIAYTPDKAFGEGDRQLKTSLGKFLTKYYPHVDDNEIRDAVAEHLAEVSNEVEFLEGDAISAYYTGTASGTSSCMTKSFGEMQGHHPSEAYQTDSIRLAVVRDKMGTITGRCLVYHHSDTDKRIIRNYGDTKLHKRLERAGYRNGCWHGAKFKTIILHAGAVTSKVLAPYLDGMNSAGSSERSAVALIDGVLTSITSDSYSTLVRRFGQSAATISTNTAGHVSLLPLDSASFSEKCEVTGKMVNVLEDALYDYWKDGKKLRVCQEVMDECISVYVFVAASGGVKVYNAAPDTPVFVFQGRNYLDGADEKKHLGFLKLDPVYYPDEQDYIAPDSSAYRHYRTGPKYPGYVLVGSSVDAYLIKEADAVKAIIHSPLAGTIESWVHQEQIGKGYTKVHSTKKGVDMYAAPDVKVVKTSTGRKVVVGIHEVETTWDGIVDFRRNLVGRYLYNMTFWCKKDDATSLALGSPLREHAFQCLWNDKPKARRLDNHALHIVREYVNGDLTIPDVGRLRNYHSDKSLVWEECYPHLVAGMAAYGYASPEQKAILAKVNYAITMMKADMNAYDYNGQHDPSMNTCPPVEARTGFATPLPAAPPWPTGGMFVSGTGTSIVGSIVTGTSTTNVFTANYA